MRVKNIGKKYDDIRFDGRKLPGGTVVDLLQQQAEDHYLKHIPWERRISFRHEQDYLKYVEELRPEGPKGEVRERRKKVVPDQEVPSDLHHINKMYTRMGVAMEVAELLPFDALMSMATNSWT